MARKNPGVDALSRSIVPRLARGLWLPLAGALAGLSSADSYAPLPVSVTVMPTARIVQMDAPAAIEIGASQLALGRADSPGDLRVQVWSNSRAGFALDVLPTANWLAGVEIDSANGAMLLGPEGGTITGRWDGQPAHELTLHVRFQLGPSASSGRYAWPLLLHVRPL
jgi:hypothetical protein